MTILTILTNFRLIQLICEPHLVNFVNYAMSFFLHEIFETFETFTKKNPFHMWDNNCWLIVFNC